MTPDRRLWPKSRDAGAQLYRFLDFILFKLVVRKTRRNFEKSLFFFVDNVLQRTIIVDCLRYLSRAGVSVFMVPGGSASCRPPTETDPVRAVATGTRETPRQVANTVPDVSEKHVSEIQANTNGK